MKLLYSAILTLALSAAVSCGSDNGSSAAAVQNNPATDPVDLEKGDRHLTPAQIDSLVNYPDDLTPGEGVGALKHLYHRAMESSGRRRDEAMRRFKDFYDIMLEIHGNDFRAALEKYRRTDTLDLPGTYDSFKGILITGDDITGGVGADEVKADTIKTYTDSLTTVETVVQ